MRFPDTPFMARTFDLIRNRKLSVKLIPYVVEADNTFLRYNGRTIYRQESNAIPDPFTVSGYVSRGLTGPKEVAAQMARILDPFRNLFKADSSGNQPDIGAAMAQLFKETNEFSVRSYMFLQGVRAEDISWCETLDAHTGGYDRALTEGT